MQIFRLIKKVFFLGLTILSNFTNALDCISMKNRECKVRSEIISINSNNPMFYPFSIKVNKCSGNCNSINDPYARICVPDVIKDLNVKVFNLMSRTNKTRFIEWHEKWNKCRCECKGLIDKGVCDKGYTWNPSNRKCESNKSCDVGEYLDYSDCKCRKKLADKLIDECTETIEETNLVNITFTENENNYGFGSCIVYIVLMTIAFIIFTGISFYNFYFFYIFYFLKFLLFI